MPLSRVSPGIALFEASITFPLHLQQQEWKSIYVTNDDVDLTILVIELWQQDVFTSITVCIAWWEWLVFDQKQTHPMSRFCFHCFLLRCIRPSVGNTFVFPFCQSLWDLTKRRDNIAVADMVADMEVDMVHAQSHLLSFASLILIFILTD